MSNKIYCAGLENGAGYIVIALAEDGHALAQHFCSNKGYARHDIGMDGSTWKHELYDKHFGAGKWELEWVDDVKAHAGWRAALVINKAMPEAGT